MYTNDNDEMVCQICCEEMPFKDRSGQNYFEAVELFTKELINIEDEAMYIALCPTCAAKYKEFIKSDSIAVQNLLKNIQDAKRFDDQILLILDNKSEELHFVEKHWLDLITIIHN